MNLNFVKSIYKFNQEAGLLEKGYVDEKESAFPIEEALEQFDRLDVLSRMVVAASDSPKDISRAIVRESLSSNGHLLEDVDRLDKHLDIIVYSFGSIFKLGLTPQQALKALDIVMSANMTKLHAGQDSHGKQLKPVDFVNPEPKLQLILDERS